MKDGIANGLAAQIWCDPTTENKVLDVEVTLAVAKRIEVLLGEIEFGWTLLANVDGGSWKNQSADWVEAVERYRNKYHEFLGGRCEATES